MDKKPERWTRNETRSGGSFAGSGLATNLPPAAEVGRRANEDRPSESDDGWKRGGAKPQRETTWGAPTTSYARRGKQEDQADDIDDKWSKAFSKNSRPAPAPREHREPREAPAPAADLPMNSRAGAVRGFGGEDRPRSFADKAAREPREFGDRPPREPFGDREPREPRGFGDRPPREPFGDRAPRDFGDRPQREPRDFGDRPQREPRDFGDRPPREPREYGDRAPRDFGDRPPREYGDRPQRDFGGRGGRGGFDEGRGGRGFGGRGRRDDKEWENDPRFASKFGRDLNPRFDNANKFDGPLPTAPKASLDSGKVAAGPASPIPIFKVVQGKEKKEKKTNKEETAEDAEEVERRKAEEEAAKQAKIEAEQAAKEATLNKFSNCFNVVKEAVAAGLKGKSLTDSVLAKVDKKENMSPEGMLKAVLYSLNDNYTATKWYDQTNYGHLLRSVAMKVSDNESLKEETQKNLVYIVQDFCHEKKFPKIDIKAGVSKRLIELLITNLLVGEIVDVEGIIAWADDVSDNDYNGRADAIVQTTGMITTLRASLVEEESEVDSDEDFDAPQQHL